MAVFLAWTSDQSGHLQGQIQLVTLDSATNLKRTSASFIGTRNGSDVSLVFGTFTAFGGETWTGKIGFRSLFLEFPNNSSERLSAGTFEDFQRIVSTLQSSANAESAKRSAIKLLNDIETQMRETYRRITDAEAQLAAIFPRVPPQPSDPRAFIHGYIVEWQKMQADWGREQSQASISPMTCYEKSQVTYTASQVSYDLSQFDYLDSQFAFFSKGVNKKFSVITTGFSTLRTLYPLYLDHIRAVQLLVPNASGPSFKLGDIEKAESQANAALTIERRRLASLRAAVESYDRQSKSLNEAAMALPETLACSN